MKSISGIYIFTNKINGKKYIGKSKNLKSRITGYKRIATKRSKTIHPGIFTRSLKKYGWNNFHLQLFQLEEDKLDDYEKSLIFLYDTTEPDKGYNLTYGGTETKYTDYARTKISENRLVKTFEARLEKTIISELKKLIFEAKEILRLRKKKQKIEYKLSDEYQEQKQINYQIGLQKIFDKMPETVIKISKALKGKKKKGYIRKKLLNTIICPHCNYEGKTNAMYRYHFDNCKQYNYNLP